MRYNNCGCKKSWNTIPECDKKENKEHCDDFNNINKFSHVNCIKPIRRHLEPVLVARIYNQPIIEEIPCSAMAMRLEDNVSITDVCTDERPICDEDCGCN